jgi:phosphoglycerate dehydrogenase-like enzyme
LRSLVFITAKRLHNDAQGPFVQLITIKMRAMKRIKCVVLDDYQKAASQFAEWDRIKDRVAVEFSHHKLTGEEIVECHSDVEILVVMRERTTLSADLLQKLPHLKLIVTSGMRNAAINVKFAQEQGIAVTGTKSSASPPLELTWALLLACARNLHAEVAHFKNAADSWQLSVGCDLHGKMLGLLGLGKIGSRMAEVGRAFGMNICAWSQNLSPERAKEVGVHLCKDKGELLAASDFVSIHLILSERTRHLIGAAELAAMKPSAFLINTSRGPIVNESALVEALKRRAIAGAGIDVFDEEPLPLDSPLRTLPNLICTPHLGYVTQNNYRGYFEEGLENIESFLTGKVIRSL